MQQEQSSPHQQGSFTPGVLRLRAVWGEPEDEAEEEELEEEPEVREVEEGREIAVERADEDGIFVVWFGWSRVIGWLASWLVRKVVLFGEWLV